jgi:hypothetical protein
MGHFCQSTKGDRTYIKHTLSSVTLLHQKTEAQRIRADDSHIFTIDKNTLNVQCSH